VCPECGFDFDACIPTGTGETVRRLAGRYRIPLSRGLPGEDLDALLRTRPHPGGWSALEYACHVRDALELYDGRIEQVILEDRPSLPAMGRDDVAVDRGYNAQDPTMVADQVAGAGEALALRLDAVPDTAWTRAGERDGWEMTVAWMARNAVHEATHHLVDVARALRSARGR
jgi:hypothetical protein